MTAFFKFNTFFDKDIYIFYFHQGLKFSLSFPVFCQGSLPLSFLLEFLNFFISRINLIWVFFIDSISSFRFQILNFFSHFLPLFACVVIDYLKGYIHFHFKDLNHIHKGLCPALLGLLRSSLRPLSCALAKLQYSRPSVAESLDSGGDIFS